MAIYHEVNQRSRKWFYMRLGVPSSSEFHKILTPGGKVSKQAVDYAHALLAELMLGKPLENPETEWMQRGSELEDSAIKAYEFATGVDTLPGGFVTDDLLRYGCSPDRLIGEDGILEMKCPAPHTHVGYLCKPESLSLDKKPQVQGQLMVTGRKWDDLMSYHPELPPVIVRVQRDEEYIASLRTCIEAFCEQLKLMRSTLEEKYGKFPEIILEPEHPDVGPFGVGPEDVQAIWEASQKGQL